jgi:hypothetical protein
MEALALEVQSGKLDDVGRVVDAQDQRTRPGMDSFSHDLEFT